MELTRPSLVVAAVSLLFLAACTAIPMPSRDETREVRLVIYDNALEVDKVCRNAGYKAPPFPITMIEGCALYTGTTCVIHARKPDTTADASAFRVLGHEAFHCFAGDWHQDRQEVKGFEQRERFQALWDELD